jgi:hypothetical protein
MRKHAEWLLTDVALRGIGDPERERLFRMCITMCLHRGVRQDELELIPQWWHEGPSIDLAGGPVEVLRTRGVPDIESTKPCYQPHKRMVEIGRPDLWMPFDCGMCPPCLDRTARREAALCKLGTARPIQ